MKSITPTISSPATSMSPPVAEPDAARILLVEPWARGAAALDRREALADRFAAQLKEGRENLPQVAGARQTLSLRRLARSR